MESYVDGSCYVTASGRKSRTTAQISQDIKHVLAVSNVVNAAMNMPSKE